MTPAPETPEGAEMKAGELSAEQVEAQATKYAQEYLGLMGCDISRDAAMLVAFRGGFLTCHAAATAPLLKQLAERDARIEALTNPSDGRCMEIVALREAVCERDEQLRIATGALKDIACPGCCDCPSPDSAYAVAEYKTWACTALEAMQKVGKP